MPLRPKNWDSFQHYKNRRPPWIKLHHSLLDSVEFWALKGEDAKWLVMIWLIASEEDGGELPKLADLAFRLRLPLAKAEQLVSRLKAWVVQDAGGMLAVHKQSARLGEKSRCKEEAEGEVSASALPPEPCDPEEIPEGLHEMQYAGIALMLGGAIASPERGTHSLKRACADELALMCQEENCTMQEACRSLGKRLKEAAPPKVIYWLHDHGWRVSAGVSTDGWEK